MNHLLNYKNKFSFELPETLIAKQPMHPPDACRLLRVKKKEKTIFHHKFYELDNLLQAGDLLVVNNSKVEARRIFLLQETSQKTRRLESIFLEEIDSEKKIWKVLLRKSKKVKPDEILFSEVNQNFKCKLIEKKEEFVFLQTSEKLTYELFSKIGQMPIPPYLKREELKQDRKDYQTIFSKEEGSAAAPTASLHFTENLLTKLKQKQVDLESLTLHVNYGTFAPLKEENFLANKLHLEKYKIPPRLAKKLQEKKYNRLISVGTTSLRVLETVYRKTFGNYDNFLEGSTDIFLYPPQKIESVDALLSNFHLPGSSLFLLVACFVEPDFLVQSYQNAIQENYRFYSYGDAMLIEK